MTKRNWDRAGWELRTQRQGSERITDCEADPYYRVSESEFQKQSASHCPLCNVSIADWAIYNHVVTHHPKAHRKSIDLTPYKTAYDSYRTRPTAARKDNG